MIRSLLLRCCLLLLGLTVVRAGEYGDAFLLSSIYSNAQGIGLSGVSRQFAYGHALNNPAGFARVQGTQATMGYDQFNGLSHTLAMEVGFSLGEKYRLGVTGIHSGVPDLLHRPNLYGLDPQSRRDSVLAVHASTGESIAYREQAVFMTLARELNYEINLGWKFFKIPLRIPLGVSMKYLDKLLVENRGLGVGFDIGGQLIFNLSGMTDILEHTEFSWGWLGHDLLNTPVYWETEHQDAIKRGLVRGFGITQDIQNWDLKIHLTTGVQDRYPEVRQWGGELVFREQVLVRAGTDGYNPSFGLGIGLKKFIIDYTFSQHELAGMQKISIAYRFQ